MALMDDLLKGGNVVTGLVIGLGTLLLAPIAKQVLRPAAKAVIKEGILAYQGAAQVGQGTIDLLTESRAELDQRGVDDLQATPSPSASRTRQPRPSPLER